MIELETRGDVRVLHLCEGENRFNRGSVDAIHAALDEVVAAQGPVALVTVGEGKIFSNGLDLDWMGSGGGDDPASCLPEVDLGLPLTPTMYTVLAAHLPAPALAEAALTGRRFTGPEAHALGIVDELAPEAEVLDRAVERAASLAGKDRKVIAEHKRLLYPDALPDASD
ncbi:MAG: enoyl-CoA hydratase/isomerase family protein [Iamia sp.]